jgi:CubicO group peptidase (beta-lactamase class C family)
MLRANMRRRRLLLVLAFTTVMSLGASPVAAKGPLSAEQAEAIRAYVRDTLEQLEVPGAAVVIVGAAGIEFAEGFGDARDDGAKATPQTPFHVASLSKQLTSIGAMQLVDSEDLSLDATVRSYIGWFGAVGSEAAKITVRDLVAQTSGYSETQGVTNRIDEYAADDALELNVRRLASEGPERAIGQYEYSNANYDVLGYLVAVVSGESYDAYMTAHVLAPLQMTHTHLTDTEARADGVAQGHYLFFGLPVGYEIPFVRGSVPSSFIAASAEDLGHVLVAHLNGGTYEGTQVLAASAMADLRRPLTHIDPWSGYGWGWFTYPLWDAGKLEDGADVSTYTVPVMLEHGGSHATYASGMLLLPEEEIGVVVLMNLNDENASSRFYQLHTGIAQILLGREAPALTSYDDFLAQNGKLVGLAWVALLVAFVAWSARRYRRWRRDPGSAPRGPRAVVRHMLLPLAIVVAQLVAFWLLVFSRGATISDVPRLVRLSPDIGLIVIVVSLVSLAWILICGIWSARVLRQGSPAPV